VNGSGALTLTLLPSAAKKKGLHPPFLPYLTLGSQINHYLPMVVEMNSGRDEGVPLYKISIFIFKKWKF